MKLHFQKYQANGNDFVMLLDIDQQIHLTKSQIEQLCDRHFGIGADGLMLLRPSDKYDFEMLYFNSDGLPASMCGNGGRSLAAMAYDNRLANNKMKFMASDGLHEAIIHEEIINNQQFDVSLKMIDVFKVEKIVGGYFMNTGVPHFVKFIESLDQFNVFREGRLLRNNPVFAPEGCNVNFACLEDEIMTVRTYERGVEDETLSCGTGVTATCIAAFIEFQKKNIPVRTRGGNFRVSFEQKETSFENIWLRGPAQKVFEGIFYL
jgi:diaminopimelate epimerase